MTLPREDRQTLRRAEVKGYVIEALDLVHCTSVIFYTERFRYKLSVRDPIRFQHESQSYNRIQAESCVGRFAYYLERETKPQMYRRLWRLLRVGKRAYGASWKMIGCNVAEDEMIEIVLTTYRARVSNLFHRSHGWRNKERYERWTARRRYLRERGKL